LEQREAEIAAQSDLRQHAFTPRSLHVTLSTSLESRMASLELRRRSQPVSDKAVSLRPAGAGADRVQGRRVDFNKSRKTTLAAFFFRYIQRERPKHRDCTIETYTLGAFLSDIKPFAALEPTTSTAISRLGKSRALARRRLTANSI
jgi:hypothetical protein